VNPTAVVLPFPTVTDLGDGRARIVYPGGHVETVDASEPALSLDALGIIRLRMSEWMLANGYRSLAEVLADPQALRDFHMETTTVYVPGEDG